MAGDKEESILKVPDPLLKKVRRLNTILRGIDNPAMTPVQNVPSKSNSEKETVVTLETGAARASTTSWVFTPTKGFIASPDKPMTLKPGQKNFHESWSNIERYLEQRRHEPIIRRKRCPCITRKCKFVTGVGILGALVLVAIILIAYFVVITKKGDLVTQPNSSQQGTVSSSSGGVAASSGLWPNYHFDYFDTLEHQNSTDNSSSSTVNVLKVPTLPHVTTERPVLVTTPNPVNNSVTDQNSANLVNLLMLPGPLHRIFDNLASG